MTAASASTAGTAGIVPAPDAGKQNAFLRGDGTWAFPIDNNTTYTFANGTDGSFTVTPKNGSPQSVSIGKPATAGIADSANMAAKVSKDLVIKLNNGTKEDTTKFTYNGSTAKLVVITPDIIGAATAAQGLAADTAVQSIEFTSDSLNVSAVKTNTTVALTAEME